MKKKSEIIVDVYSSPTMDLIDGRLSIGGPGYYIAKARKQLVDINIYLRLIGCGQRVKEYSEAFEYIELVGSGLNIFKHERTDDGRRNLTITSECEGLQLNSLAGDIAIVSATYWDIPVALLCKIVSSYRITVIDVQGYSRLLDRGLHSYKPLLSTIPWCDYGLESRHVIRASMDDINIISIHEGLDKLINVLTWDGELIAVRDSGTTYVIELGYRDDRYLVGAGDIYDLFLALSLLYKGDVLEAAIAAHVMTLKALNGEYVKLHEALNNISRKYVRRIVAYPVDKLAEPYIKHIAMRQH